MSHYSIVTGNGFTGNAQRFAYDGVSSYSEGFYNTQYQLVTGKIYNLSFKYRTNRNIGLVMEYGADYPFPPYARNDGNAISAYASAIDGTTYEFSNIGFAIIAHEGYYAEGGTSSITIINAPYSNISFTTHINLAYEIGDSIEIHDSVNWGMYVIGTIVSYNSATGAMEISPTNNGTTGTTTSWILQSDPTDEWFEIDEVYLFEV